MKIEAISKSFPENKNIRNMKVMMIAMVINALGTICKSFVKVLEDMKDELRPSTLQHGWDQPKYRQKSRRLATTQTPIKDHKQ